MLYLINMGGATIGAGGGQYPPHLTKVRETGGLTQVKKVYHLMQNFTVIKLQLFAGIFYISSNSVSCAVH